jgi:5,10-methylenetetrahydrofolate reductase
MKSFKDTLASEDFIITSEIGPPKGVNCEKMLHHIELLKEKVHAMNVTDNQSSVMRLSSLAACHIIKEKGAEPILQMTCRDRNRMALQSDLLSAYVLGIRNVLCLTGDHIGLGDHKGAKQVFDLDSVQLISAVKTLQEGKDLGGNTLDGAPSFCIGATATPEAENFDLHILKVRKKIEAGAEFFQTQAVYDVSALKRFVESVKDVGDVKVLAGILVLFSPGMIRYLNENVAGVNVPDNLLEEMKATPKEERIKKGVEIAARQIKEIKEGRIADGVHIMAIGKEEVVVDILKETGL